MIKSNSKNKEIGKVKKRINSRAKGATGERELANYLSSKGYSSRRGQQFCGANGDPDIICGSLSKLAIECKRVQNLNIDKALSKCNEDKNEGQIATVWHRKNGEKWKVTLSSDDFLELLKEGYLSLD